MKHYFLSVPLSVSVGEKSFRYLPCGSSKRVPIIIASIEGFERFILTTEILIQTRF